MVTSQDQVVAAAAIATYRERLLEPAHLAPLGVERGPVEARTGDLVGLATLVRPEEAVWNLWGPERRPLLFNDRAALLVVVDVSGEGDLRWVPDGTRMEVNRPEVVVPALSSAEHLLAELAWFALEQERWLLDGDLVQRTRYAGGLREAFARDGDGAITGVVAFALPDPEVHVAALRVTLALTQDGAPRELVWVFQ